MGFAREWTRLGHQVHVVTGPGDRGGEPAPELAALIQGPSVTMHRAAAPGIPVRRPCGRPGPTLRISRFRQILGQWRGFPDLQRSWIGPATQEALRAHASHPFDVVWSTSPPESVHFVGNRLAEAGIPWVADFRDQWSDYLLARWDPLSRLLIDHISRVVLRRATLLMANADGVAASIERATRRGVKCVRNGFDPQPPADGPPRSRVLGYFGRIDPLAQHPERLWEPLRRCRAEGRAWQVEFFLTAGGSGGGIVRPPDDLADLVAVGPALLHDQALSAMQRMTALLVLGWQVRAGEATVAGKLYEYVGAGRPVLVCAPAHYEARKLIEERHLGVGAWTPDELVGALAVLERHVPAADERARLARAMTAREALSLLEEAVARSTAATRGLHAR